MLQKRDTDGGEMGSPRQGLGMGRYICEHIGEFCWKGFKGGAGFMLCCWAFYVIFLMLSTHPCWQSSQCWASLVMGNNSGHSVYHVQSSNRNSSDGPTSLEHIVFGIAASAKKWKQRKRYVDIWWQPGKTRGFVWLDRHTDELWSPTSPPYRISEDTSGFNYTHPNGMRSAIRISRIVSETFRLGLPNVRWFVMGDDDTMFFTDNLVQVLSKYDHNQYYYIGYNSECTEQNVMHSYAMAFGGGGFAISYPLAKALEKIQDECLTRYEDLYGSDQRIQACLAELGVPLTKESGFHQVDIHGNLFGLLAAHPIAPLVSLHHLDAVSPVFPNMTRANALRHLMEAVRIDQNRVLQQSICYDKRRRWTISVSWGFCIQIYGRIQLPRLLEYPLQTFITWRGSGKFPFSFNTRPVPRDPCEKPVVLFMESVSNSSRHIVSSYTRQAELSINKCNEPKNFPDSVQTIKVVSDKMRPDWTQNTVTGSGMSFNDIQILIWQAPRRQCCELVSSTEHFMEIKIRSCREGEAISPPP